MSIGLVDIIIKFVTQSIIHLIDFITKKGETRLFDLLATCFHRQGAKSCPGASAQGKR